MNGLLTRRVLILGAATVIVSFFAFGGVEQMLAELPGQIATTLGIVLVLTFMDNLIPGPKVFG